MPTGFQSDRGIVHYAQAFRLADRAGLLSRPDLAEPGMAVLLALHGVEQGEAMDRRQTIIDVARPAGVSRSTVSLALQNSPQVKAETREAVRRAMEDVGHLCSRRRLSGCLAAIGLRVGRDLRVVGLDDIEDCAEAWPALTLVSCGVAQLGRTMAGRGLDWLQGGARPPAEPLTPVGLVVRASSGQ